MPTNLLKETRSYRTHSVRASEDGTIEAIVAVFSNVDSYNTRMRPGCFAASLEQRKPKVLFSHDMQRPIGVTDEARELAAGDPLLPESIRELGGLYVKGRLNLNTVDGREAYEHLKFGSMDQYSFGFYIDEQTQADDGTVWIERATVLEWSPVAIASNDLTQTISINAAGMDMATIMQQLQALPVAQRAQLMQAWVLSSVDGVESHADMKGRAGRVLSKAMRSRLGELADTLEQGHKALRQILRDTDPDAERAAARRRLAAARAKTRLLTTIINGDTK